MNTFTLRNKATDCLYKMRKRSSLKLEKLSLLPDSPKLSDSPKISYGDIFKRLLVGDLGYALGRFYFVRRAYSTGMKLKQSTLKTSSDLRFRSQITGVDALDVEEIVADVKRFAYCDRLQLQHSAVAAIKHHAESSPLCAMSMKSSFALAKQHAKSSVLHDQPVRSLPSYWDIKKNPSAYKKVAMVEVQNSIGIEEIYKLRYDDFLLKLAERYLGYKPEKCDVKLWWSFANDLSSQERRSQNQTIDYHYDIYGFNSFYINFYLTDVDSTSGAHVLVKSSHRRKKMSLLLRSARVSEDIIRREYEKDAITIVEGKAGACFVEDASCFHKALPPVTKDRLFLQLRYL